MTAQPIVEVPTDGAAVLVGNAGLRCNTCGELVPIPVEVKIAEDADGDRCVFTDCSVIDLEAHQLTHLSALMDGLGE